MGSFNIYNEHIRVCIGKCSYESEVLEGVLFGFKHVVIRMWSVCKYQFQ